MKTNYTHQPEKAYEKPGEWGTIQYTSISYEMPAQNAIIETVMSIENQELVFAEGNNGNASAESVAVATMSTGKKKVVVVDGTTQVCTLDEDNNTVIPVTVFNYRGPLRTGDIDITIDGVINATALAPTAAAATAGTLATIEQVLIDSNPENEGFIIEIGDSGPIDIDGANLLGNVKLINRISGVEVAPTNGTNVSMSWSAPIAEGSYDLVINGSVYGSIQVSY